jgi:hypothetical protein
MTFYVQQRWYSCLDDTRQDSMYRRDTLVPAIGDERGLLAELVEEGSQLSS